MSSDVSCFENIIGLTRTPCSDYSTISSDYTTSDSGLYLDELIPLSKWESILNCKWGENVFEYMEKARDNAIIDFRIDATEILTRYNKLVRNPFKGRIGKVKRSATLTGLRNTYYYGIVLRVDDIVGGEILITDISTMFSANGTVDVIVKNNLNTTIGTYTVNTVTNTLTANTVAITLPTHSDYVENLEYYFLVQYDGTNIPYDNAFYDTCSSFCGSKSSQSNKQFGYAEYMMASGIGLSSISDLSDVSISSSNKCYGLSIGLTARCKVEEIWCYDEMDYVGNSVDMAIAKCVRMLAAINVIRDISLSENLNYETVIDGQTLGAWHEQWTNEYSEMIDFIVKNIDVRKTDCFECGHEVLLGVGKIRS